ncbi:GAF domain-containing protein [Chitinimonas arctica]|uniref:histidine kinase n=1 Tax=Chitinimonas arctica TaxID=2594795 RepID=A0A516SCJ8_9NEIS|nr:PAS domain-containing protein [Chitinimonas arctica]QDQ25874.1 GAF domain-containing protein [Chitinimonas arctica]
MSLPDFHQLFICSAEELDDPGGIADALLEAAKSAQLGVFVWEVSAGRLIWNDGMYRAYGLAHGAQLDGNAWLALLHPDDLLKVSEEVGAALRGERPYDTVFRVRAPDGGWRHIHGTAWVERNAAGQPLRMAGINQDVSISHRFDLLVKQVQASTANRVGRGFLGALANALCQALGVRYAMVLETFPAGSASHARTLALSVQGVESEPREFALAGTPSAEVLAGHEGSYPRDVQQQFPDAVLLRDLAVQSYLGVPLVASDGTMLGLIAVLHDQPYEDGSMARRLMELFAGRTAAELERLRREVEVRRLNAELEGRVAARTEHVKRTMRELEAFTYAVSHDLNAPLRAVHGFGSILREDYADRLDDAGRDYLERTLNAAERMGRLLDDLVSLSKISLRPLNVGKVHLTQLALEIVADLQNQHPHSGMEVTISPHLVVHADPGLMRILLDCLLRNAWRFTEHMAKPSIALFERQNAGRREFVVQDNGSGFDAPTAERLFAPFQSFQGEGGFTGGGTGLAIAQRVIHRHHGGILSQSRPGEGAAFAFWLPPAGELMALLAGDES